MRATLDVSGPRAADDVWDRYLHPARWPEWSPQIRSVDYPAATLRPDSDGTVHGPLGFPVRFRIVSVAPSPPVREWTWAVSAAGIQLHLRHTVEATPAGARTTLTIDGFAPAVTLYLPAARWALHRLVR